MKFEKFKIWDKGQLGGHFKFGKGSFKKRFQPKFKILKFFFFHVVVKLK